MDIGLLATTAVSLLVPYLAKLGKTLAADIGEEVSGHVRDKVKVLYETIKNKLTGNDCASQTLERLEEKPEDKGRQDMMASVLKESLPNDPQFQKVLDQLLSEIEQGNIIQTGSGTVETHRSVTASGPGSVAVGGNAGNINTGRPQNGK